MSSPLTSSTRSLGRESCGSPVARDAPRTFLPKPCASARGEVTYLHHKSTSVRRRCGIPSTVGRPETTAPRCRIEARRRGCRFGTPVKDLRLCRIDTTVVAQVLHHHEPQPRDCRRCQFATTVRGLGHPNFGRPDGSVNLAAPWTTRINVLDGALTPFADGPGKLPGPSHRTLKRSPPHLVALCTNASRCPVVLPVRVRKRMSP